MKRALIRLRNRNQITLPAEIVAQLGLTAGGWLELSMAESNSIQLRPAQIVTAGTPEADRQERAAAQNIRDRKYSTFRTIEEFDRHLDQLEQSNAIELPAAPSAEPVQIIFSDDLKKKVLTAVSAALQSAGTVVNK